MVTAANGLNAQVAHVTRDGGSMKYIEDPYNPEEFKKMGLEAPQVAEESTFDAVVYRLETSREIRKKAAAVAAELVASYEISYAVKNGIQSVFKDLQMGTFLEERLKEDSQVKKKTLRRSRSIEFPFRKFVCGVDSDVIEGQVEMENNMEEKMPENICERAPRLETLDSNQLNAQTISQKSTEDGGDCPVKLSLFCSEFVIKCYQEALAHTRRKLDPEEIRVINLRGEACSPMAFEGFLSLNEKDHHDWKLVGSLHAEFTN
jgi:hypothetical protein